MRTRTLLVWGLVFGLETLFLWSETTNAERLMRGEPSLMESIRQKWSNFWSPPCDVTVETGPILLPALEGSLRFPVYGACHWEAKTSSQWITFYGRSENEALFKIGPLDTQPRVATITIGDEKLTVIQAGTLDPYNTNISPWYLRLLQGMKYVKRTLLFAIGLLILVLFLWKIKHEHDQGLPAENQFLPTPNESVDLIIGDNPDTNESLISEIYRATSAAELMAIVGEYDLDGEECAAFLIKALEFDDRLDEEDWEIIYEAAEEGSELRQFADSRRP